jgi:alpha-methylacyl-CoA racemase
MTDGAALLMAMLYGVKAAGLWSNQRGANLLDGGAFFYATYACADGKFLAVGPIEPQFYRLFLETIGIDDPELPRTTTPLSGRRSGKSWPPSSATRTRAEWCALLEGPTPALRPCLTWTKRRAPTQPRPRNLCHSRRRRAAGAGAPSQPHAGRDPGRAAGAGRPERTKG